MPTIDEQIDKINNDVAGEICWAESYEECDQIIEKGKLKIAALFPTAQVPASWRDNATPTT